MGHIQHPQPAFPIDSCVRVLVNVVGHTHAPVQAATTEDICHCRPHTVNVYTLHKLYVCVNVFEIIFFSSDWIYLYNKHTHPFTVSIKSKCVYF